MISYYSSIIILTWLTLGILCVLIRENNRIEKKDKRILYLTYSLIAVSALAEWCGLHLNGNTDFPVWALKVAKCCDYILTPMTGGALVAQMRLRDRPFYILIAVLTCNAIFQIISVYTGWMFRVDENHLYSHGPLYTIYILVYLAVIILVIIEFINYGRSFRRQNRFSLYAIMSLVFVGILMQEIFKGDSRTVYITITIAVALMFIHYTEFSQQAADEHVLEQQILITTDALTGLQSRYAYSKALETYNSMGRLPDDLAVFAIDINELKEINDNLGHEAGDELICGAAQCIRKVFADTGKCYRTGGDEFVVLAHMKRQEADAVLDRLKQESALWHGETVQSLTMACGYALAADHTMMSCEKLAKEADMAMYAAKSAYYRTSGKDRRRRAR